MCDVSVYISYLDTAARKVSVSYLDTKSGEVCVSYLDTFKKYLWTPLHNCSSIDMYPKYIPGKTHKICPNVINM